jgi:transposase
MDYCGASRQQLLDALASKDAELAALRDAVAQRDARLAEMTAQVAQLADRVAQLQARLDRDSSNSSRPPSSDPPYTKKKPKRGMRGKSGRRPGKQPGSGGQALRQVEDPDEIVLCDATNCPDCGRSLSGAPVIGEARRQVFDPPPAPRRPHVTEYRIVTRRCGCGARGTGLAPAGVAAPTSYGPHAAALAVWATAGQHLPVARATTVLARLAGIAPSTGWLVAQRARAARLIEAGFLPQVRALLRRAGLLHVDETPGRAAGKLAYVHVAATEHLTAMHVGDRSKKSIDAGGVLAEYDGTIVRDGYAGYTHLAQATHAWCGAHSLRDLRAVYDADPDGQAWADSMAQVLCEANRAAAAARAAGQDAIASDRLARIVNYYRGSANLGVADNEGRRGALAREALALARRFVDREDMILRFATDLTVPMTNNQAERDCRPVKVAQRASGGCWRTLDGLTDFAVVHSYLSTASKWGKDSLDALHQLFTTGPWLPPDIAPT